MGHRHRRYALLPVALLLVVVISFAYLPRTGHAGSSDLTVDSIWLEDASQPGQPISQVSSGQSFLIVATIKNIGQETASGYYVDVYYDNDYGRGGPDNILAGEVQTWYVGPLTAQDGTHTTKWVVDPDNLIAELDETNNQKEYTFTVGSQTSTTTATSSSTSSSPDQVARKQTLISTVQNTQFLTSILTTTLTSYIGTLTSTSTIVVPATVIVGPSTMTATAQTTQVLTSTGTTTVTGYTTTTVTSYIGTSTSTSTIVVPTTVAVAFSTSTPIVQTTEVLPATSTVQIMQVLTSTGTTTVTGYTTTTVTSYTGTSTSTSTSVVYTTVASLAGSAASSPLAYLGFISLLAIAAGQRAVAGRSRKIPHMPSHRGPSRSPLSVPRRHASSKSANVTRSLFAQYHSWKGGV